MSRPMGIRASFSKVTFKKDGEELFTAQTTSGGCFGPVPELNIINAAYGQLRDAVDEGKAKTAALDFNEVSITNEGGRTRSYSVSKHDDTGIDPKALKRITP